MDEKERYKMLARQVRPVLDEQQNLDDAAWIKASVMTNLALLENFPQTWKQLLRLKELISSEELQDFRKQMFDFREPWTVTDHGFGKTLTHWKEETLTGRFSSSYEVLAGLGREHFLTSGTLLGFVREGNVLEHDDDIDFGVMLKGDTLEEVVADMFSLQRELFNLGVLDSWKFLPTRTFARLKSEKIHIDLFPSWVMDGKLYCWPHGIIEVDDILPIDTRETVRGDLNFPANPEAVLKTAYGESWRVPDKTYTYPWNRTFKVFKDYQAEYKRQLALNMDLYPGQTLD
jgi:hypothetical protein